MFFHSLIAKEYAFTLFFFTVNSSVNVARLSCRRTFLGKGIKLKTFPPRCVINLCGAVVSCCRVQPKVLGSSPTQLFFFLLSFFSAFCVVVFYKYIINNCYLIKCNKQQVKYCVSREKIVHRILNTWINNLNFYHFLQFTVGKPELITT